MAKKGKHKGKGAARTQEPRQGDKPVAGLPRLPRRYEIAVALALLVGALAVLYPEVIFQNRVLAAGDTEAAASMATPIRNAIDREDTYPLWNPYLFSGMPSYESLAYNPYVYPVSILTTFLSGVLHFPGMTWLLFHNFMLGLGVWLILRDRGVHFMIAAGAGVLMMWMPNFVAIGAHGHGSQANAIAYLPFALFFWDRVWRGRNVVVSASALVILLGFQLLRAHLQISYYTFALIGMHALLFGGFALARSFRRTGGQRGDVLTPILPGSARPLTPGRAGAEVGTRAAILAVVVVASLLVSAVLFLPVQDYAKHSIRGGSEAGGLDYDYATSWSLHPREMLTFVVPSAFGFGKFTYHGYMPFTDYPNYLGALVVMFAVLAVVRVRRPFVWFLACVMVVSTLVAFGKHMPVLYAPLFKLLPYFNKFRVPVMILIVQQLAVVLLFGFGLSAALDTAQTNGRKWALWCVVGSGVLLLVFAASGGYWTGSYAESIAPKIRGVTSVPVQRQLAEVAGKLLAGDLIKVAVVLLAGSGLWLLYARRMLKGAVFVGLTLIVSMIDLFGVSRAVLHPDEMFASRVPGLRASDLVIIKNRSERDRFMKPDPVIDFLSTREGPYRVLPVFHPQAPLRGGEFGTNRYMNFGISSIGGYHAAKLSIYEQLIGTLGHTLQRGDFTIPGMLNARYVVAANPFPDNPALTPVWQGSDYLGQRRFVYENTRALPRAFFVDNFTVLPREDILPRMASGAFDPSSTVLLEHEPAVRPLSKEGAQASITHYGFNEIRLDAKLESAAILVLSEVFYPRWQAFVDGAPAEVLRANHLLRAVALPAGSHAVVFRYDTSILRKSLTISVATFVVTLAALLVAVFLRTKGPARWKLSS